MIDSQKLYDVGIDYEAGLTRFLNNPSFYEDVLRAFINDPVFSRIENAFLAGDMQELQRAMHEIKGTSGNANFTTLYNAASELLLILRSMNYTFDELQKKYENFCTTYILIRDGVKGALSN